jgi:hypothetical protein
MFNQNVIDLAVKSTHPPYRILGAFDPLLSSNTLPDEQAITPEASSSTSTETYKTDEFLFDQD